MRLSVDESEKPIFKCSFCAYMWANKKEKKYDFLFSHVADLKELGEEKSSLRFCLLHGFIWAIWAWDCVSRL